MRLIITLLASSNTLQSGKIIIWQNKLYYGNSSNKPITVSIDLSSYATQSWVSSNYAAKSHSHSDYATKNNPTLTGTIHLNSTDIRLGANSSSSNVKVKFGDGEYIYMHEDTDDHLTFYSKKGIDFTSLSNSATFSFNGTAIGGGSGKAVTGSTSYTGSNKTVNIGFEPNFVIFCTNSSYCRIGIITPGGSHAMNGTTWKYDTMNSYTYSSGFYFRTEVVSGSSQTMYYVAFG